MSFHQNHFLSWYASVAVFLFMAVALVLPSGYSLGAFLLMLAGFYSLIKYRLMGLVLSRQDLVITLSLLVFSGTWLLEIALHDPGVRELDKPLRFIFAVFALFFLIRFPPRPVFFWFGAFLGASLTGLWAGWQRLVLGYDRAEGFTNAIQFGNISLLLGVMCLAGLGWAAREKKSGVWQLLLIIGFDLGFLGSVFTGSRGGWLAMPVVLLSVIWIFFRFFSWRFRILLVLNWLFLFSFALFSPYAGGQERLAVAFDEYGAYAESMDKHTSIGIRLELWKAAVLLIPERPWLGWGTTDYMEEKKRLIETQVLHPVLYYFDHVHNELLNTQLKRGVVGVLGLLALYLVPLWIFFRRLMQKPGAEEYSLAAAGLLLCLCYGVFGLTQVFFAHNSGVMIYAFMLVIIWSMLRNTYVSYEMNP